MVSNTVDDCLQKQIAKKSSNWKSKLRVVRSLHCFQTLHFICNWFGCKLWLQSIQNHARHRFQDSVTRKPLVCVLARPTRASSAGERPQKLGRWFNPLNLRLPSGTVFGEIARWPAGAQTWTQTSTLQPDFYRLRNHSITCVEFEFFLSSLLMPNLSQAK